MREVIDVDDLDIPPRPEVPPTRTPARSAHPVTISLIDSDSDDPVLPQQKSRSHPPLSTPPWTELQRITQSELSSRRLLRDKRLSKKRTTDPMQITQNTINHNRLKRKECTPEIIEISSDSEPEIWPAKRQKVDQHVPSSSNADGRSYDTEDIPKLEAELSRTELCSSSPSGCAHFDDEQDDCINFLAALDISNEANWIPLPERNKAEDLSPVCDSDTKPSKLPPRPTAYPPRKKHPVDRARIPLNWDLVGPWGLISKNHGLTRFPKPFYHARRREHIFSRRSSSLYYEKGYNRLHLTAKYPHLASGSINKIIQAQGSIVLCAAVAGGLDESDDDEDDRPPPTPENKVGSLVVYRHGRAHTIPSHCRQCKTSRGPATKYYSVSDVAFNPSNTRQFLSSGYDRFVQAWEILDHDDSEERAGWCAIGEIEFDSRPQDLLYSPDGSALAITFYNGIVRMYSQDLFSMIDEPLPPKKFLAAPVRSGHAAGSALWGEGPSKHLLFTSSEPRDKGDSTGFHYAWDTYRGTMNVKFDAAEAGDAVAISPDGSTLALFTCGKDGCHPVRLYDVRRKVKEAYETEELDKFQVRPSIDSDRDLADLGEVNQASFSPDGRLLAVARNDNVLHVYDVRALSRGPLCRFAHHDSDTVRGGEFGIVGAKWRQGRDRIGIVTGGDDGCVRLWEPLLGSTDVVQGAVMGRTDFDVGHFSIGEQYDGEFPLVIGDCGGGVHTYEFANEDGIPI